jgi:hypothetical protein
MNGFNAEGNPAQADLEGKMQTIAFKAEYYAMCAPCASTDAKLRAYICGISVSGWRAAATDGNILLVTRLDGVPHEVAIEPAHEAPESIILPMNKELARHCRPSRADHGTRYMVVTRGEGLRATIRIATGSDAKLAIDAALAGFAKYTLETSLVDGVFPDYRQVLPRADAIPAVAPAFNLALLEKFQTAAGDSGARIVPTAADKPAMVTFARKDAFGVIMPMRNDDFASPASPPDWIS